jgi:glycoside/pentoside/hexuronide:cation symporter, GPH family
VAMGAVVGGVGTVTIYTALIGLRETHRPVGETMSAGEAFKATYQNRQFLVLLLSALFVHISYQMLLANFPYFVTLVLGQGEGDVGLYQGVLIIMMALTGMAWTWLNRKYGQRVLLNASMILLGIALAFGYFVGTINFIAPAVQAYIFAALTGMALGGYFILIYAMVGNVVDYDETLTHRRREAIYYGAFSFGIGLGMALGTLILPLLLQNFGYTRANPLGVRVAFLAMAAFAFIGCIVFQKYRLGDTLEETRRNLNLEQ